MTDKTDKNAAELSDDALDDVKGGAETVHLYLQANGEAIKGERTARAGLRSDGELVQAVSEKVYR